MPDRYAPLFAALRHAVLEAPAQTKPELRRAAAERGSVPAAITPYVTKVHTAAADIADADIEALRAAGYDDDAIFEITVAAAVGAATHQVERVLGALDREAP